MEAPMVIQASYRNLSENSAIQAKWQRIVLLFVLGYEAAGALLGGILLMIAPDGRLLKMPVEMMNGVFRDFMIPGVILFVLGLLNGLAFLMVLYKKPFGWIVSMAALSGMLVWFWIEIAILLQLHWLHAMWGLPVLIGLGVALPTVPSSFKQKALLHCGILSSVLYFAINLIVPYQWAGYSYQTQTVSELSAINAPTRLLWLVLVTPYTFLILAFGMGVYKTAEKRSLRITGILLLIYGALGLLWPFAPMHLRETLWVGGGTISDTLHIVLGVTTQIIYLLALVFAATSLGKRFGIYSLISFILVLILGALTFMEAPGIANNEPTPMIGVWERINIGLFLVWVIVLALILLHHMKKGNVSMEVRDNVTRSQ
ncbi:MAG: DUF998 domain-containing protein [Flavisolibacter sp.]